VPKLNWKRTGSPHRLAQRRLFGFFSHTRASGLEAMGSKKEQGIKAAHREKRSMERISKVLQEENSMRVKIGTKGVLERDLPAKCCSTIIEAGMDVIIVSQTSPNRVMVMVPLSGLYHDADFEMCYHKVKASKIWFTDGTVEEFDMGGYKRRVEEQRQELATMEEQRAGSQAS